MRIRLGFDIAYSCAHATPTLFKSLVEPDRESDLIRPERVITDDGLTLAPFTD